MEGKKGVIPMKRIYLLALALVLFMAAAVTAYSAGGDQSDPVVTQSYVQSNWKPDIMTQAMTQANIQMNKTYNTALRDLAKTVAEQNEAADAARTQNRRTFGRLVLKQGDVLLPTPGCKLTLYSGNMSCDSSLIDVTNGAPASGTLKPRTLYMQGDAQSPGLTVSSATAEILMGGTYRLTPSASVNYGSLADALSQMGLFRGMTTGYELEGGTTRAQGLVMFLRLLGLEEEALKCSDAVPFTDVPATHWAHPYVSYAYGNGLTTGVTGTSFQPDAAVTSQHYLTFLLRALQYAEGSQFTYNTVLTDAPTLGLFSQQEVTAVSTGSFRRSQMVYLSYYALFCENGQSGELLLESLISSGAVPEKSAYSGLRAASGWRME